MTVKSHETEQDNSEFCDVVTDDLDQNTNKSLLRLGPKEMGGQELETRNKNNSQ